MEARRFDSLTRRLAGARTRRAVVGALIAGASVAAVGESASAGRATCRAMWASCTRNQQCCTGTCATGRTYPRVLRNRCVCIPDCGGGKCNVSDGCGNFCPGCDDGLVCGEENTCKAPCAGTTGYCWLTKEGAQALGPAGCQQQFLVSEPCSTNDECEENNPGWESYEGGNVEMLCVDTVYLNGAFNSAHPAGRCIQKPPANGACWG